MPFSNDDRFTDDYRKVGHDSTSEFAPVGAPDNPTEHASSENLGVAAEDDDLEDADLEDGPGADDLDEDDDEDDVFADEEDDDDDLDDDDDDEEDDDEEEEIV